MSTKPQRRVIPDPYPETIGVSALTIWVPEDFCGDAEVTWWYPGKSLDEDRQRITCSTSALLQGVFHNGSGERPSALFDARVVALVLHAFYRARIEAAAHLEAAYEWRSYAPESNGAVMSAAWRIAEAKRELGAVMSAAWKALSPEDFESATIAARTLRQLLAKGEDQA